MASEQIVSRQLGGTTYLTSCLAVRINTAMALRFAIASAV